MLLFQSFRYLGIGHRTVKTAFFSAFDRQFDDFTFQRCRLVLRFRQHFRFPGILGCALALDLFQCAGSGFSRQFLGKQEAQTKIEDLTKQVADLTAQAEEAVSGATDDVKAQIEALTGEKDALAAQIETLTADAAKAKDEAAAALAGAKDEAATALQAAKDEAQATIDDLTQKLEAATDFANMDEDGLKGIVEKLVEPLKKIGLEIKEIVTE